MFKKLLENLSLINISIFSDNLLDFSTSIYRYYNIDLVKDILPWLPHCHEDS